MTDETHIRRAYAAAAGRDPGQTAFLQALETLYESLTPFLEEQGAWAAGGLAERLGEPERTSMFPVVWTDGRGRRRQARGFFIQYSTALGPWRGAIAIRRGLDLSAAKALALMSALEAALAGLATGGGFAGADADVRAMDDRESMAFCRAFMEGLYPLLPPGFHPARWTGQLPRRELDCLAGRFQQLAALAGAAAAAPPEPVLARQKAAGWGLCRFAELAAIRQGGAGLAGQTILLAGRDGAAGWAGERAVRLGARVVAAGDARGFLWSEEGLPLATLQVMAAQPELPLLLWAIRAPGVEYRPGPGLWDVPADMAFLLGGARLDSAGARQLLSNRCAGVFEGTVGAATAGAARTLTAAGTLYAPAIAAGAGPALLAGRQGLAPMEAERHLRGAMHALFRAVWAESELAGRPGELFHAAFSAAFRPIADAIMGRGL